MNISSFENIFINSHEKFDEGSGTWVKFHDGETWYTSSCTTFLPGRKGGIGRVDHFTKTSMKTLINAVVRQIVKREGQTGRHTVKIVLNNGVFGSGSSERTVTVFIDA